MMNRNKKVNIVRMWGGLCVFLVLTMSLVSCSSSQNRKYSKEFAHAVEADDFVSAGMIYAEAAGQTGFDQKPFVKTMEQAISRLEKDFSEKKITYDEASIRLQEMQANKDLVPPLAEPYQNFLAKLHGNDDAKLQIDQAKIYAEAKNYRASMNLLADVLKQWPENIEAKQVQNKVLAEYIQFVTTKADDQIKGSFPQTALALVEGVLPYAPENQDLLTRQKTARDLIQQKYLTIQQEVPKYELKVFLQDGRLTEAQAYINQLKERKIDVTLLQPMLDQEVNLYIQAVLESAANLANHSLTERWPVAPNSKAIAKVDEALNLYPDNVELQKAKAAYEKQVPENATRSVQVLFGTVNQAAVGADANGYQYREGGFDSPLYTKPDAKFNYAMKGFQKTRILFSPKTDDLGVYQNMVVDIKINGNSVYSENLFGKSLKTLDLTFDTAGDAVVEITIMQSGFASFFDNMLGRNAVFVELYRI